MLLKRSQANTKSAFYFAVTSQHHLVLAAQIRTRERNSTLTQGGGRVETSPPHPN